MSHKTQLIVYVVVVAGEVLPKGYINPGSAYSRAFTLGGEVKQILVGQNVKERQP